MAHYKVNTCTLPDDRNQWSRFSLLLKDEVQ